MSCEAYTPLLLTANPAVAERELDPDLRDTEQVSLLNEGGIDTSTRDEVCPCATDVWCDSGSVKVGYEINFNLCFQIPQSLRPLEEIPADILALEQETEGLLAEIVG